MVRTKRKFSVYGNCQAAALAAHLLAHQGFASKYEYIPLSPCFSISENEISAWLDENSGNLDLLISLDLESGWRNGNPVWDVANVKRSLKDNGRFLTYNRIFYRGVNPLFVYPKSFPRFSHCDYMDLVSLTLQVYGFGNAHLCERIYHHPELFTSGELSALHDLAEMEFFKREENCHIKFAKAVSKLCRTQPAFFTFNHPNAAVLNEITTSILTMLEISATEEEALTRDILDAVRVPLPNSISLRYSTEDCSGSETSEGNGCGGDLVHLEELKDLPLRDFFEMSLNELRAKSQQELDDEFNTHKRNPISAISISAIERQLANSNAISCQTLSTIGNLKRGGISPDHLLTRTNTQTTGFMMDLIGEIRNTLLPRHHGEHFSVLDLGAKTAAGSQLLGYIGQPYSYSKLKFSVTCADIDQTYVEYSRATHPHVEYVTSDVFDLDRQWDIVICSHVIEHVPDPLGFVERLKTIAGRYIFLAFPYGEDALNLVPGHVQSFNHEFLKAIGPARYTIYDGVFWSQSLCCIAMIEVDHRTEPTFQLRHPRRDNCDQITSANSEA